MKRKMLMMSLVAGLITTINTSILAVPGVQNNYITKSKAKAIALQHAGLKESEVTFVNGYLSYDDGRAEYEIEFWKGNQEYDYEIDAITGNILSYDYDIESYSILDKREQINNNPYIPQAKKDLINSKLDIKEGMIQQTGNNYITKDKAKAIALQHAGLKESDVTFVNGYLSYDDGRAEYEIEFWKGNQEYDYEIDAITGNILSYDYDIEHYVIPIIPNVQNGSSGYITKDKAKAIALQHAGLKESDVTFVNGYLTHDDGRAEYEIEFWKGNQEYDYEIDAITGNILSYDYDIEYYVIPNIQNTQNTQGKNSNYITESKAKAIALQHAGVKESEVRIKKVKFDYDDGRAEYEVEFHQGRTEYEYTIDAVNGTILEFDMDND